MNEEKKVQIQLEKHLWPDEVIEKRRKKRTRILTTAIAISVFIFGFLLGSDFNSGSPIISESNSSMEATKFDSIMGIMESQWFYGSEIENLEEYLLDQALYGLTETDIDKHTTYMSREEIESFTTGIDMGFVGIGVQYSVTDGANLITRVFHNSPAEAVGVLPGDMIYSVDGINVVGMESDKIAEMVKGSEGSKVTIEFIRDNEIIEKELVRAPVLNTAYGEMIEDEIGYLQIYQFGSSTADETEGYLELMSEQGLRKLVIDVRDDGGGYLASLVDIASLFLPDNTIVMQQVYANGAIEFSKANKGMFENIEEIVILQNENTASAAEVFALALKEERDDVTLVGTTTYGKGTVQVTHSFIDGSAIKFTTSKWLSPSGVWVEGEGIEPDIEVYLHDVLYDSYSLIEEETFALDSVDYQVQVVQNALDFLGYELDRRDGYFDESTATALISFQDEFNITSKGIIDKETMEVLMAQVTKLWSLDKSYDAQLQKALEVLNDTE